jgi:TrkA domain protein
MSHTRVQETLLPGVGVRHDFVTEDDTRIGVLNHHAGHMDLLVYDDFDPDSCSQVVRLTEDEGHLLGELLGASQVVQSITNLQQSIGGLAIDWIEIGQHWTCADKRIDSLRLSDTGVLIVAVIRGDETTPIPARDFQLQSGDTVVVIGQPEGIQRAYHLMHGDS